MLITLKSGLRKMKVKGNGRWMLRFVEKFLEKRMGDFDTRDRFQHRLD